MRSVRRHLTSRLLAGSGAFVAVCGVGCFLLVGRTLTRQFDDGLVSTVAALASHLDIEHGRVDFDLAHDVMPEFSRPHRPDLFQIWIEDGSELVRSASLGPHRLPSVAGSREQPEVRPLALPDGRPGRAVGIRVSLEPDPDERAWRRQSGLPDGGGTLATVVCARDTQDLSLALRTIAYGLAAAAAVFVAGIFVLVRWVVTAVSRPIRDLAARIDRMEPEGMSATELAQPWPEEIEPFRRGVQRFTIRIAESIDREKRIAANLAHELRTPVAELSIATELARRWPDDSEIRSKAIEDAHEIAIHMHRVLRACLRVARLQSGADRIDARPVDVSAVLAEACRKHGGTANGRDMRLEEELGQGCTVRSDPEIVELILANLVDNAVHHATAGAPVRVTAARHNGTVLVTLANLAAGLDQADLTHLGEPFWRKDDSRSDKGHAGLGLAMVQSAAMAIGADVRFAIRDGCFEVRLALPWTAEPQIASSGAGCDGLAV